MCNVCEANAAIEKTKEKPSVGYQIHWKDKNNNMFYCYIAAEGVAEGPGKYKLRRSNEEFKDKWKHVECLSTAVGNLGFDLSWQYVPSAVKRWVKGKITEEQMMEDLILIEEETVDFDVPIQE